MSTDPRKRWTMTEVRPFLIIAACIVAFSLQGLCQLSFLMGCEENLNVSAGLEDLKVDEMQMDQHYLVNRQVLIIGSN